MDECLKFEDIVPLEEWEIQCFNQYIIRDVPIECLVLPKEVAISRLYHSSRSSRNNFNASLLIPQVITDLDNVLVRG